MWIRRGFWEGPPGKPRPPLVNWMFTIFKISFRKKNKFVEKGETTKTIIILQSLTARAAHPEGKGGGKVMPQSQGFRFG